MDFVGKFELRARPAIGNKAKKIYYAFELLANLPNLHFIFYIKKDFLPCLNKVMNEAIHFQFTYIFEKNV